MSRAKLRIVVGADHAGFELASTIAAWLRDIGHEVNQVGARDTEPYDYSDASDAAVCDFLTNKKDFGILCCGSGTGICIRANRYPGIRSADCTDVEIAELARSHNQANFLCLGSRILAVEEAKKITEVFLSTPPDPAERHHRRVKKLDDPLIC